MNEYSLFDNGLENIAKSISKSFERAFVEHKIEDGTLIPCVIFCSVKNAVELNKLCYENNIHIYIVADKYIENNVLYQVTDSDIIKEVVKNYKPT